MRQGPSGRDGGLQEERALVAAVLVGGPGAAERFVRTYEGLVTAAARARLRERGFLQDSNLKAVVARVFDKLMTGRRPGLRTWDGERPLGPWLTTIAQRQADTFSGRQAAIREHETAGEETLLVLASRDGDPVRAAELRDERRVCLRVLRRLPPGKRRIVWNIIKPYLQKADKKTFEEIGALVKRKPKTVQRAWKDYCHRVRDEFSVGGGGGGGGGGGRQAMADPSQVCEPLLRRAPAVRTKSRHLLISPWLMRRQNTRCTHLSTHRPESSIHNRGWGRGRRGTPSWPRRGLTHPGGENAQTG